MAQELSKEEIEFFVNGAVRKEIDKEQIGAMLMAIFLRGMTAEETVHLTRTLMLSGSSCMARRDGLKKHILDEHSSRSLSVGEVLVWTQYPGRVVDKHSTGGVGDKISLPLAPALAVHGLKVRVSVSSRLTGVN